MCGLCGLFSGQAHWADLLPQADEPTAQLTRRDARRSRINFLNTLLAAYACKVTDWQGSKYQLSTYTGKVELVDDLQQLWLAVERMTGRVPDPLAPEVAQRLEES